MVSLVFSRDGRRVAAGSAIPPARLTVWDGQKEATIATLPLTFEPTVVSFNPMAGESMLAVLGDGQLQLCVLRKTPRDSSYVFPSGPVSFPSPVLCCAWTPASQLLLGCENGTMLLYDCVAQELVPTASGALDWYSIDTAIRRASRCRRCPPQDAYSLRPAPHAGHGPPPGKLAGLLPGGARLLQACGPLIPQLSCPTLTSDPPPS